MNDLSRAALIAAPGAVALHDELGALFQNEKGAFSPCKPRKQPKIGGTTGAKGVSGWVTVRFSPKDKIDIALLSD